MSRPAARAAAVVGALLLVGGAVPVAVPAPARAADLDSLCTDADQDRASAEPGAPLNAMRIDDAHAWLAQHGYDEAGTGVVVAVLDSGVSTAHVTPYGVQDKLSTFPGAVDYHGTAVAGIIAGAPESDGTTVGIAPKAQILDIKVYDGPDDGGDAQDDITPVSATTVAAGLEAVLALKKTVPALKIVNVSARVDDTTPLKLAVHRLLKNGVLVVASSGNRSFEEDDPLAESYGDYQDGENAAGVVFPAGYDDAIAVSTTADGVGSDPLPYILQNSQIDVAAPTSGAPTYTVAGASCVLRTPTTSWAAAEVTGVLAMLASTYRDEGPEQLRSRLLNTASGRDDVRNPLTGAGVVQPYDALTRPGVVGPDGTYDQVQATQERQPAEPPPTVTDPLGSTRHDMVWFGVVGGGVLVLALVLRPVLARRRRTA